MLLPLFLNGNKIISFLIDDYTVFISGCSQILIIKLEVTATVSGKLNNNPHVCVLHLAGLLEVSIKGFLPPYLDVQFPCSSFTAI